MDMETAMDFGLGLSGLGILSYGVWCWRVRAKALQYPTHATLNNDRSLSFSMIVVYRNEAERMSYLLQSLAHLDFPHRHIEIIFVNDGSTDQGPEMLHQWRVQHPDLDVTLLDNIRMTNAPKKDALLRAMSVVRHPWVVCTDADCALPPSYFTALESQIKAQPHINVWAGPVAIERTENPFSDWQHHQNAALLGLSLAGIAHGQPWMVQGGNLCFQKAAFEAAGGFGPLHAISSGDDVHLVERMEAHAPGSCRYWAPLEGVVRTLPLNDGVAYAQQQIRWAAKSRWIPKGFWRQAQGMGIVAQGAVVLGTMLGLMDLERYGLIIIGLYVIKSLSDYALMDIAMRKGWAERSFPWFSSVLFPWVAVLLFPFMLYGAYTWKGQRYRDA